MRPENLDITDASRLLDDLKREGERARGFNKLDLADAEKRMGKLLSTPEGKEAFRRITGMREAVFAGEVQQKKLPIVAILMPSYKGVSPDASNGLVEMMKASFEVCHPFLEPTLRQSVVHWTRNNALTLLNKTLKPWDYVLFMDDDMVPPPDALSKLLAHQKDLVAAACTVRMDPPMPNFRYYHAPTATFHPCLTWPEGALLGGFNIGIGTGMVLLSRNCLTRVGEYYINCKYEQKYYGFSGAELDRLQTARQKRAKDTGDFWWFEFLKQPQGLGEFGEDISFCFKCIELGIPVYVDTTVRPKHTGEYGFNLDDFLELRESYYERLKERDCVEFPDSGLKAVKPAPLEEEIVIV